MASHDLPQREISLNPDNWDDFKALAHRMVEDTLNQLAGVRERRVWQETPAAIRRQIADEPLPRVPQGDQAAFDAFREQVRPYPNGNLHPRFSGWVQGGGTPLAVMADMLASALNPHMAGFNQAPAEVEFKVISWMAELMGFPSNSGGLLTGGGTMANILALAVARQAKAGFDVRGQGLQSGAGPKLTVYCSTETHGWIEKGVELLGIGRAWLRKVPVKEDFQMDVEALTSMIRDDKNAGHRPICAIGTAGTVNTGATDDLRALAELCRQEDIWFHVDGAFGALARLSPSLAPLVEGVELADSLVTDLHKWMSMPFECACLLVKDAVAQEAAFKLVPEYLMPFARGISRGGQPFADRGIDLTRSFRALKAWMSIKAYGIDRFATVIEQNVAQAKHMEQQVLRAPELELLVPVSLNVVCFRYNAGAVDEAALSRLNSELLMRLQESGVAAPSSTLVHGKFALRACFVNHRTRLHDVDETVKAVLGIGAACAKDLNGH